MHAYIHASGIRYKSWYLIDILDKFLFITAHRFACDFDTDFCGWTESSQGPFKWVTASGETPDTNTGPSSDHTSGTGTYLYVDASDGVTGDQAHIISSTISQTGPGCEMIFWYHMFGDHIGTLQVGTGVVGIRFISRNS